MAQLAPPQKIESLTMLTQNQLTYDDLTVGDVLGRFSTDFTRDTVDAFASITDTTTRIYRDCSPTLAYDTLHAVKAFVELPQGTVHSKEAVEFHAPISPHLECVIAVSVADVSVRRGKQTMCLRYDVYSGSTLALTALKTFVLPGKSDLPDTPSPASTGDLGLFTEAQSTAEPSGLALPTEEIVVSQDLLDDFGRATATDGPIHTDPAVATPLFGGTILQGMYLFETASQMMTSLSSPPEWLSSGRLAAKIVGSSITGETVRVSARLLQVTAGPTNRADCAITATTDTGRTVFVARADAPMSVFNLVEEVPHHG
ncbi:hypothetical protein [Brevibacterium permense]|uniref:MaoC-like domain-containing protein n=1 Tax=Brevibacterium permense TaxID=234834 RepID=A0ABN2A5W6_9MICO|nr:hypothetical protein [Brevibacterium permense]